MDFKDAVALLKRMEVITKTPDFDSPSVRVDQSRTMGYGDAVGLLKSMQKKLKLTGSFPIPSQQQEASIEKETAQETKQPSMEVAEQPTVEEPTKGEQELAQKLSQEAKPLEFKKESAQNEEEVVEIRPLLGIEIPSLEDAEKLALQRAESLKSTPSSKEELSKKLIDLTSALLREKDPQARAGIKSEINHIKELLKGTSPSLEDLLKKMFKEDISNAVSVINSALKVYEGLEQEDKIKEELKKAVLTYESYLEHLHSTLLKHLGLDMPLPSYDELKTFISGDVAEETREKPAAEQAPEEMLAGKDEQEAKEIPEVQLDEEGSALEVTTPVEQEEPAEEPEKQVPEKPSEDFSSIIDEINSLREGQLLHELGARDRRSFLSYLRGEVPKEVALKKAKVLLAVEKGMPEERAKEVFS